MLQIPPLQLFQLKLKANEDERHHRQLEDIARGNGIKIYEQNVSFDNVLPVENRTNNSGNISITNRAKPVERTMSDDELINKSIEFLFGKGFSVSI